MYNDYIIMYIIIIIYNIVQNKSVYNNFCNWISKKKTFINMYLTGHYCNINEN